MENGAKDKADDICRELVADYACPLAIRISAWQTRAVCAGKDQYYEAMQYLENAVALCDRAPNDLCLPSDDPEILRFKENCVSHNFYHIQSCRKQSLPVADVSSSCRRHASCDYCYVSCLTQHVHGETSHSVLWLCRAGGGSFPNLASFLTG